MLLNSSRNCVKGSDAGGRQARALSQNLPIVRNTSFGRPGETLTIR